MNVTGIKLKSTATIIISLTIIGCAASTSLKVKVQKSNGSPISGESIHFSALSNPIETNSKGIATADIDSSKICGGEEIGCSTEITVRDQSFEISGNREKIGVTLVASNSEFSKYYSRPTPKSDNYHVVDLNGDGVVNEEDVNEYYDMRSKIRSMSEYSQLKYDYTCENAGGQVSDALKLQEFVKGNEEISRCDYDGNGETYPETEDLGSFSNSNDGGSYLKSCSFKFEDKNGAINFDAPAATATLTDNSGEGNIEWEIDGEALAIRRFMDSGSAVWAEDLDFSDIDGPGSYELSANFIQDRVLKESLDCGTLEFNKVPSSDTSIGDTYIPGDTEVNNIEVTVMNGSSPEQGVEVDIGNTAPETTNSQGKVLLPVRGTILERGDEFSLDVDGENYKKQVPQDFTGETLEVKVSLNDPEECRYQIQGDIQSYGFNGDAIFVHQPNEKWHSNSSKKLNTDRSPTYPGWNYGIVDDTIESRCGEEMQYSVLESDPYKVYTGNFDVPFSDGETVDIGQVKNNYKSNRHQSCSLKVRAGTLTYEEAIGSPTHQRKVTSIEAYGESKNPQSANNPGEYTATFNNVGCAADGEEVRAELSDGETLNTNINYDYSDKKRTLKAILGTEISPKCNYQVSGTVNGNINADNQGPADVLKVASRDSNIRRYNGPNMKSIELNDDGAFQTSLEAKCAGSLKFGYYNRSYSPTGANGPQYTVLKNSPKFGGSVDVTINPDGNYGENPKDPEEEGNFEISLEESDPIEFTGDSAEFEVLIENKFDSSKTFIIKTGTEGNLEEVGTPTIQSSESREWQGEIDTEGLDSARGVFKVTEADSQETKEIRFELQRENNGETSISLNTNNLNVGETLDITVSTDQERAEKGYSVEITNSNYMEESNQKEFSGTWEPESEGEYTVRVLPSTGILSSVIGVITGGTEALAEKKVTVEPERTERWIEFCGNQGYNIDSTSDKADCIENEIVPSYFQDSVDGNPQVADSLCQDVVSSTLGENYEYDRNSKNCIPE